MRLLRCFLNDLRVQRRSGFWTVYGILCALYSIGLYFAPSSAVPEALVVILFADPCALGFYFVGGFAYLERDDGTFSALMVTPLDWREHLGARVLSFTALALAASFIVVLPPALLRGTVAVDTVRLTAAVGLGAIFFTIVGLLPASRFSTINDYIVAAQLWLVPFLPPFLARYGFIPRTPFWRLLPTGAVLDLLDQGLGRPGAAQSGLSAIAAPVAVLAAWIAAAWLLAARSFEKRMVGRLGSGA